MAVLLGCTGSPPTAPEGAPPLVLLRDMIVSRLPSPYYHFGYDASGRVQTASFASGFTMYDVMYQGDRISELQNHTLGNQDRLEYLYDGDGRVGMVSYVRPDGLVRTRLMLSYAGQRLTRVDRQLSLAGGFTTEKTVSLSYDPDGNLLERTERRPFIAGRQEESTTVDRFEQYDDGINVDGFDLLHSDFFDHLVLLPGVVLQRGNPALVTRSGDGTNYRVDYSYTYDDRGRPLRKNGDLLILNGPDTGRRFQIRSVFTYY